MFWALIIIFKFPHSHLNNSVMTGGIGFIIHVIDMSLSALLGQGLDLSLFLKNKKNVVRLCGCPAGAYDTCLALD